MKLTESLSNFNLSILWFGAAVSLAEIMTGALIAPLGISKGLTAIIIGHIIGCVILFATGQIGSNEKLSAIETTKFSFGRFGAPFFAILNIIQLIGWTGVMIASGAAALGAVTLEWFQFENTALFSLFIAGLICFWIVIGFNRMKWFNLVAVASLFVISVILGFIAFTSGTAETLSTEVSNGLSFGLALELSIVMPLSWLPLISDYTRHAKDKSKGPVFSALGYFTGSTLMYAIGLGAALYAGTSDISTILIAAGLPLAALLIVLLSTVTTTFLDVYSAAVSFNSLKKADARIVSIVVCLIGASLAIFVPTSGYESFLYLIGSAFAPLFAILLTDYFLLGKRALENTSIKHNIIIWCLGVVVYRLLMTVDTPLGNTLPTMMIVSCMSLILSQCVKLFDSLEMSRKA